MFKEAFLGLLVFVLLFLICYRIRKQSGHVLTILIAICLLLGAVANLVYNSRVMFPDYYMEVVSGTYRYGTFSGNLFAYNDEFMYRDTALFPILRGRNVMLDDGESAGFYNKFFTLYSKSVDPLSVTAQDREKLLKNLGDFSWKGDFSCIKIIDYATDEIPASLEKPLKNNEYPAICINTASLRDAPTLAVVVSPDYTVYIMSLDYYNEVKGVSNA